ncbi:lipase family protein [Aeromicrobium sp.]|uniref:lipase family protein n=1 Tax=Aeromicrobium sp. TaxID=1871063 RepID=UPI0030C4582D
MARAPRQIMTLIAAAMALILVTPTSSASAAPADPSTDPFFAAPANLGTLDPGTVIRSRPVSTKLIPGIPLGGKSYQILLRSNDAKDRPAAVTATIIVPRNATKKQLLAYQPATDSLGAKCEPSYALQTGSEKEAALIAQGLSKGLTVVVPDHQGPRHAYAAGRMAGHATLDAVRAATRFPEANLAGASTKVGMVGYSGGAIATGWAAQLHPSYAPDINLVGVASGGTPADLEVAGRNLDGGLFSGLFLGAALGVMREYPELRSLLNAEGLRFEQRVKNACVNELVLNAFQSIKRFSDSPDPLAEPVTKRVLGDNKMGALAPTAPVMLWHATLDELIPYRLAPALRDKWCSQGTKVKLVTNRFTEHNLGAVIWLNDALPFLLDRYAGKPVTGTC